MVLSKNLSKLSCGNSVPQFFPDTWSFLLKKLCRSAKKFPQVKNVYIAQDSDGTLQYIAWQISSPSQGTPTLFGNLFGTNRPFETENNFRSRNKWTHPPLPRIPSFVCWPTTARTLWSKGQAPRWCNSGHQGLAPPMTMITVLLWAILADCACQHTPT